jgi:hypothetical protein
VFPVRINDTMMLGWYLVLDQVNGGRTREMAKEWRGRTEGGGKTGEAREETRSDKG